jgi:hypothetical protein
MMVYAWGVVSAMLWVSSSAQEPVPAVPAPPPAMQQHRLEQAQVRAVVTVNPAQTKPGETVSITLDLTQNPSTPGVTYGASKPLEGLEVEATWVSSPSFSERRRLWPTGAVGSYGCTFTPSTQGTHALYLKTSVDGKPWEIRVPVAVGVWPADPSSLPVKPSALPALTEANVKHGEVLCASWCRYQKPFLSTYGNSISQESLLRALLQDQYNELSRVQLRDIGAYVRTLYVDAGSFFPKASHMAFHTAVLSPYAKERLGKHKILVSEEETKASLFVAYAQGEQAWDVVPTTDTMKRDLLKPSEKRGYLVFAVMDGYEWAMQLGKEPTYPIVALQVRSLEGKDVLAMNKQLASFVGQGRFNDVSHFAQKETALGKKVAALYLRAAEYATAYVSDEREFTAFNAEFQ